MDKVTGHKKPAFFRKTEVHFPVFSYISTKFQVLQNKISSYLAF